MTDAPQGAFVELDINSLDKRELIMLGQKSAMDKWTAIVRSLAGASKHPFAAGVLDELATRMQKDLDEITTELSARAIRHKAGTMHEIKPGRGN